MRGSHVCGGLCSTPPPRRRQIERLGRAHSLARHLDDFLTDLVHAGASGHTPRAYRGNLIGRETGRLSAGMTEPWGPVLRHCRRGGGMAGEVRVGPGLRVVGQVPGARHPRPHGPAGSPTPPSPNDLCSARRPFATTSPTSSPSSTPPIVPKPSSKPARPGSAAPRRPRDERPAPCPGQGDSGQARSAMTGHFTMR